MSAAFSSAKHMPVPHVIRLLLVLALLLSLPGCPGGSSGKDDPQIDALGDLEITAPDIGFTDSTDAAGDAGSDLTGDLIDATPDQTDTADLKPELPPETIDVEDAEADQPEETVVSWPEDFGLPCGPDAACESLLCVWTADGQRCSAECDDACPEGWACRTVTVGAPVPPACAPIHLGLCHPCASDEDCRMDGLQPDAICLAHDPSAGSFCHSACDDARPCPDGYVCAPERDGGPARCQPESGACDCDAFARVLQAETPCASSNDAGSCAGVRVCADEGLTDCDAPPAEPEVCDGEDNDCDGVIDGAAAHLACDDQNPCTVDQCFAIGCKSTPDLTVEGCCAGDDDCDDGDFCTVDACVESTCEHPWDGQVEGCCQTSADCDDGLVCTTDLCQGGHCSQSIDPAVPSCCEHDLECDDGDACTTDACDLGTGDCSHGAVECADGFACTIDACDPQVGCVHTLLPLGGCCEVDADCAAGPCQDAHCDPEERYCVMTPLTGACDDGDVCTTDDACIDGVCVGKPPAACDDGVACTDDLCDPATGACLHVPRDSACEDGAPCTWDVCLADSGCASAPATDGTACDDGDACSLQDTCAQGACAAGFPLVCDDDDPCTVDTCDPDVGACGHVVDPEATDCCDDDADCDDEDPCTADACVAHRCEHAPDPSLAGCCTEDAHCDDEDACTMDACDVASGDCAHDALGCDDELACTVDSCDPEGGCVHDLVPEEGCCLIDADCEDQNACTTSVCDPEHLYCVATPVEGPCDDLSPCTLDDACVDGACVGAPLSCDDGVSCTVDACDPEAGGCVHLPDDAACPLSAPCWVSSCDVDSDCVAAWVDCDDGDPCTTDACDPVTGECTHEAFCCSNDGQCDDDEPCTIDDCVAHGCVHTWNPAVIGCCRGATDCNDGNPCTVDACVDEDRHCEHSPKDCADGSACTLDWCDPGDGSCRHAPLLCDDDNACTLDACDPAVSCAHTFLSISGCCDEDSDCDDGNGCTVNYCHDEHRFCVHTDEIEGCDDLDPCTIDHCEDQACEHTPDPFVPGCCADDEPCETLCGPGVYPCEEATLGECDAPEEYACWDWEACEEAIFCEPCPEAPVELCDGVDNDCDGLVDAEDDDEEGGEDGPPPGSALELIPCERQAGVCAGVIKLPDLCINGVWAACGDPRYAASAPDYEAGFERTCDGLDNDCDGLTDEDFGVTTIDGAWIEGVGVPCGLGVCAGGASACTEDGLGVTCPGEQNAAAEICSGVDDDCDGLTDGDDPDVAVPDPIACDLQAGVCEGAVRAGPDCLAGEWLACTTATYVLWHEAYEPDLELKCDGLDNDCDGLTDEDFALTLPDGTELMSPGEACGVGVCADGVTACSEEGDGLICSSEAAASEEICDGLDNDCDGYTDDDDPDLDTSADPANCGQCGQACGPYAHAYKVACVDGGCVITDCVPGFEDADDSSENGCETWKALPDVWVDASNAGDPLENGTELHPFARIDHALEVVPEGVHVHVRAGSYPGPIAIDTPNLILEGVDRERVFIEGPVGGIAVSVSADDVEIRSLTVSGAATGIALEQVATPRLTDVHVTLLQGSQGARADGVFASVTTDAHLDSMLISAITGGDGGDAYSGAAAGAAAGVRFSGGTAPVIEGLVITDVTGGVGGDATSGNGHGGRGGDAAGLLLAEGVTGAQLRGIDLRDVKGGAGGTRGGYGGTQPGVGGDSAALWLSAAEVTAANLTLQGAVGGTLSDGSASAYSACVRLDTPDDTILDHLTCAGSEQVRQRGVWMTGAPTTPVRITNSVLALLSSPCLVNTSSAEATALVATWSTLFECTDTPASGATVDASCLSDDPLFIDGASGDLHLQPGSPCVDAADPGASYFNEPSTNGCRSNMGAYGDTAEAASADGATHCDVCEGGAIGCAGACVDPQTDPLNCGGCGQVCVASSHEWIGACQGGACAEEACPDGAWNANLLPGDGCEYACAPSGGGIEACDEVDNDCDGQTDEDFVSDPANCGLCGAVCGPYEHVLEPGCDRGRCVIERCEPGWLDVDLLADTGCEQRLTEIHVDAWNTGDPRMNGTASHPFDTLGEAFSLAEPGALVFVHAGSYDGGLSLETDQVQVRGDDLEQVRILTGAGGTGLTIKGDHVQVSGVTVTGGRYGVIVQDAWGVTLEDLTVSLLVGPADLESAALVVKDSEEIEINDLDVEGVTGGPGVNEYSGHAGGLGAAIIVDGASRVTVRGAGLHDIAGGPGGDATSGNGHGGAGGMGAGLMLRGGADNVTLIDSDVDLVRGGKGGSRGGYSGTSWGKGGDVGGVHVASGRGLETLRVRAWDLVGGMDYNGGASGTSACVLIRSQGEAWVDGLTCVGPNAFKQRGVWVDTDYGGPVQVINSIIGLLSEPCLYNHAGNDLGALTARYSALYDCDTVATNATISTGCDHEAAIFVDEYAGDLHVADASPTIDAGDPETAYDDEPAPNGCRVNQGAYGGTVEATTADLAETCAVCDEGLMRCDGACVDPQTDAAHCGGCGQPCPTSSRALVGACEAGACVEEACPEGSFNANLTPADGCELACTQSAGGLEVCDGADNDCDGQTDEDFVDDPAHCGGCDQPCGTYDHVATPACERDECAVGACEPGWMDLNGEVEDGCEHLVTELWVDAWNGADPYQDGSLAHPFDDLAPAFEAAADGAIIHVAGGTYSAGLTLSKPAVRLIGVDRELVWVFTSPAGTGLTVQADDVVIDGISFSGGRYGVVFDGAARGTLIRSSLSLIAGPANGEAAAVHVTGSQDILLEQVVIDGVTGGYGTNDYHGKPGHWGVGLSVSASSDVTLLSSRIHDVAGGPGGDATSGNGHGGTGGAAAAILLRGASANVTSVESRLEVIQGGQGGTRGGYSGTKIGAGGTAAGLYVAEGDGAILLHTVVRAIAGGLDQNGAASAYGACALSSCPGAVDLDGVTCIGVSAHRERGAWVEAIKDGPIKVTNTIFSQLSDACLMNAIGNNPSALKATYSLFDACAGGDAINATLDDGCFQGTPGFIDPDAADYHPQPDSEAIDAGDPDATYDLEPEPNGCRLNLGAYGGTKEAASLEGAEHCPGDRFCEGALVDCSGACVDLETDPSHCLACGVVCPASSPYTRGICAAGACAEEDCEGGHFNANLDPADGCELLCSPTHGGIEACDGIDNDCDADIDEGFDRLTDPRNCGECGIVCGPWPHVDRVACAMGHCAIAACAPGFLDTDALVETGCEVPRAEVFVDADNAGDLLEDGSAAHPFDRLQEGLDAASPGARVHVAPGTYAGGLTAATDDVLVLGSGHDDTYVVTDPEGTGLTITGARVSVSDMSVTGGRYGVVFQDTSGGKVTDCFVGLQIGAARQEAAAIAAVSSGGIELVRVTIDGVTGGWGPDEYSGVTGALAAGVLLDDSHGVSFHGGHVHDVTGGDGGDATSGNGHGGIGGKAAGIYLRGGASNLELTGSTLHVITGGPSGSRGGYGGTQNRVAGTAAGVYVEEGSGAWLRRSLVYDVKGGLGKVADMDAHSACVLSSSPGSVNVDGLTCAGSGHVNQHGVRIEGVYDGPVLVLNSIIHGLTGSGLSNHGSNDPGALTARWSLFDLCEAGDAANASLSVGCVNGSPSFVAPGQGDYHLQADSPAIDSGDPESTFSHEPSPNGCRRDMGAYGDTEDATAAEGAPHCLGDSEHCLAHLDACHGVCRDLALDPRNCGDCDVVCAAEAGDLVGVCQSGACAEQACDEGSWDVDGDPANGCEYACDRTVIGAEPCNGVDDDCDGRTDEDHDLMTDLANCGLCGQACGPWPGVAEAACELGECRIRACEPGYLAVDDDLDNGCELPLQSIWINADNAGDPAQDGSVVHPFDTIQEGLALAATMSGARLIVAAGAYVGPLTVEASDLVIDGAGRERVFVFAAPGETGVTVTADRVTLSGLTVTGGQVGVHFQGVIRGAFQGGAVYSPSAPANETAWGVHVESSDDVVLEDLVVRNVVGGLGSDDYHGLTGQSAAAIRVQASHRVRVQGLEASGVVGGAGGDATSGNGHGGHGGLAAGVLVTGGSSNVDVLGSRLYDLTGGATGDRGGYSGTKYGTGGPAVALDLTDAEGLTAVGIEAYDLVGGAPQDPSYHGTSACARGTRSGAFDVQGLTCVGSAQVNQRGVWLTADPVGTLRVVDSVFAALSGHALYSAASNEVGSLSASYSVIWQAEAGHASNATLREGMQLDADPQLVDLDGQDYHLLPDSPAIDAGAPGSSFADEPAPNGCRRNLGAFGDTAEATAAEDAEHCSGMPSCDAGMTECLEGCVDLQEDPVNCQACGAVCPASSTYVVGACQAGACVEQACDEGEFNANLDPVDGCELICTPSNAGLEACDGLDNDCDGLTDEDFDLASDAAHCGACGEVCGPWLQVAEAACAHGACVIQACDPGALDADSQVDTGCEATRAELWVDAANPSDPLEDGSALHPYDQLQEALDAAPAGALVHVAAGSYAGALSVEDDDLVLAGAGDDLSYIVAGSGQTGLTITSHRVTLRDITITGGRYGVVFQGSEGSAISDCALGLHVGATNQESAAVLASAASGLTLTDVTIDGVTAGRGANDYHGITGAVAAGVLMDGGHSLHLSACVIEDVEAGAGGDATSGNGHGGPGGRAGGVYLRGGAHNVHLDGVRVSDVKGGDSGARGGYSGTQNKVAGAAGGVIVADGSGVYLTSSVIYDVVGGLGKVDSLDAHAACALVSSPGSVHVDGLTCVGSGHAHQHGLWIESRYDGPALALNSVFSALPGYGLLNHASNDPSLLTARWSLFDQCALGATSNAFLAEGCQTADPVFVDPALLDYRLQPASPGVDAGDPSAGYDPEPAPNGCRRNLGAYGGTPLATAAEGAAHCLGDDLNCLAQQDACDGICRNVLEDPRHCGTCGTVCEVAAADQVGICQAGQCGQTACAANAWDLDRDPGNGCEHLCEQSLIGYEPCDGVDNDCDGLIDEDHDLMTDLSHCGACGQACGPWPGVADVACVAGACVIEACVPGFMALDDDLENGCEHALSEIFVDADNPGDPDEDGSAAHPFDAIAEGLALATASGGSVRLRVAPGAYAGPLLVDAPSVSVEGVDRDRVFVFTPPGETAITVTSDAARVEGLTLTGGQYGVHFHGATRGVVARCAITSVSGPSNDHAFGVRAQDASGITITDLVVRDVVGGRGLNDYHGVVGKDGGAIWVEGSHHVTIQGLRASDLVGGRGGDATSGNGHGSAGGLGVAVLSSAGSSNISIDDAVIHGLTGGVTGDRGGYSGTKYATGGAALALHVSGASGLKATRVLAWDLVGGAGQNDDHHGYSACVRGSASGAIDVQGLTCVGSAEPRQRGAWLSSNPVGPIRVVDSVFAKLTGHALYSEAGNDAGALSASWSLIWEAEAGHGSNATLLQGCVLDQDPLFVSADDDDYHLQAGSPALDAGAPISTYRDEPNPNGCRRNLGAFGDTAQATSATDAPHCERSFGCAPGLVNCGDRCVDPVADPSHCGGCGLACEGAGPLEVGVCSAGACATEACADGSSDANGLAADGCELPCSPGDDGVEACDGLDDDCDGLTDETFDLAWDAQHCGACGQACGPWDHVTEARCVHGGCRIVACEPGWWDEDQIASTGCEGTTSALYVDAANLDDPAQDGSEAHPYAALADALAVVTPVSTIHVAAGAYTGGLALAVADVAVVGAGADQVQLTSAAGAGLLVQADRVSVTDLSFTGGQYGLRFDGVTGGQARHLTVSGLIGPVNDVAAGVAVHGSSHVVLQDLDVTNVQGGEGAHAYSGGSGRIGAAVDVSASSDVALSGLVTSDLRGGRGGHASSGNGHGSLGGVGAGVAIRDGASDVRVSDARVSAVVGGKAGDRGGYSGTQFGAGGGGHGIYVASGASARTEGLLISDVSGGFDQNDEVSGRGACVGAAAAGPVTVTGLTCTGSGLALQHGAWQTANPAGPLIVSDAIFADLSGACLYSEAANPLSSLAAVYSDLWACTDEPAINATLGDGCLFEDPLFVDTDNDDLHLQAASPGVDTGAPDNPYRHEPDPNGCRRNMGAYGDTPEATSSPDAPHCDF